MNELLSGGALGADLTFGKYAKARNHKVTHYHFDPKKSGDCIILSDEQLALGNKALRDCAKTLGRSFPPINPHSKKLLQRNFWQVRDTFRVYAVSTIDQDKQQVTGGTGWAVHMFLNFYPMGDVFVFDQDLCMWFKYSNMSCSFEIIETELVPAPTGIYTGIGTRKLNADGEDAIRNLYGL